MGLMVATGRSGTAMFVADTFTVVVVVAIGLIVVAAGLTVVVVVIIGLMVVAAGLTVVVVALTVVAGLLVVLAGFCTGLPRRRMSGW
jgi:hypothetical protein